MSRNAKVNQVILILIDDVKASHLFRLMDEGRVPNIAALANNGIKCRNCITTFPSITFPAYSNIIIGSYSGYYPKNGSGIPIDGWIARTDPPSEGKKFPFIRGYGDSPGMRKLNKDIGKNVQTIFEQAGDGNFLSSLNLINRGSYVLAPKKYTSEHVFKDVEEVFENPRRVFQNGEIPKVTVMYISYTDELRHNWDFNTYINEIIKCDEYLGSFVNLLKEKGYYDSTAIAIVSDHGSYQVKKHQYRDFEPLFNEVGLIPYDPKKGTGNYDASVESVGYFYFPGDNWHYHPTIKQMENFKLSKAGSNEINLFETLWKISGVKFMYYRDDNNKPDKGTIHLEKRNEKTGEKLKGKIEYEGHGINQKTRYTWESNDLFGYDMHEESQKILDNKSHNIDEWLKATNLIDYPILIDQLPRFFKNPRSSDIMTSSSAETYYCFYHGKTLRADPALVHTTKPHSHDVALKKTMTVPLIIGGSLEIPEMEIEYSKTTDVVPTLLDLLGIKPHWSVVGKSLFDYQ